MPFGRRRARVSISGLWFWDKWCLKQLVPVWAGVAGRGGGGTVRAVTLVHKPEKLVYPPFFWISGILGRVARRGGGGDAKRSCTGRQQQPLVRKCYHLLYLYASTNVRFWLAPLFLKRSCHSFWWGLGDNDVERWFLLILIQVFLRESLAWLKICVTGLQKIGERPC